MLRSLGILLAAAVLGAGALTGASPARATPIANGTAYASAAISIVSDPKCSGDTSGSASSALTDTSTRSPSLSLHSTITNSDDPTDRTPAASRVTSTATQKVAAGGLASVDLKATLTLSIKPAHLPSACADGVSASAYVVTAFAEPTDGFLDLDYSLAHGSNLTLVLSGPSGSTNVVIPSLEGTASERIFVQAGSENLTAIFGAALESPVTSTDPTALKAAESLHLAFHVPGAALAKATGPGASYASFPDAVDCAHHTLQVTLAAKARQASLARLYVNGALAKTVMHPAAGRKVKLSIPTGKDSVVRLSITRNHRVSSGRRTYVTCD